MSVPPFPIDTTLPRDRIAMICDFKNANWDRNDSSLFELVGAYCLHFPALTLEEANSSIAGYEGDKVLIKIPFRIETEIVDGVSPTVNKITVQVIAKKAGQTDFIIEEKIFNTELIQKCRGQQLFDIVESRNYISYPGDPYNTVSLGTDENYNSESRAGSILNYPMVLRYEQWVQIVNSFDANDYPIFEDNCNITNRWSSIANGWALAVRFKIEIQGYDEWITPFQFDIPMTVRQMGTAAVTGPVITPSVVYTDEDENEVEGIIEGGITHVRHIYEGDFSATPAGTNSIYGYAFSDKISVGGVTSRRFASTAIPSEDNSPFSPTDENPDADSTVCDGNLRMNIFGTDKVIIEFFYDDTLESQADSGQLIVQGRLGFYLNEEEETLPYYL